MHRQTFISDNFFVQASVAATKTILQALPTYTNYVQLVNIEDRQQSLQFLYVPDDQKNYRVAVSLLPLNTEYTQVSIHIEYTDGHTFQYDSHIRQALAGFERIVQQALPGNETLVNTDRATAKQPLGWMEVLGAFATSVNGLFIWKRIG